MAHAVPSSTPHGGGGGGGGGGYEGLDAAPAELLVPVSGSGLNLAIRDILLVINSHEVLVTIGKFVFVHNAQSQELTLVGGQQIQQPLAHVGPHASSAHGRPAHAAAKPMNSSLTVDLGVISAIALCGRRQHIAVCRAATRDGAEATVSIHNLKTGASAHPRHGARGGSAEDTRRLHAPDGQGNSAVSTRGHRQTTLRFATERFGSVALSTDGKLVCCQTVTSTWTIVVWDWTRDRQIAIADVHNKVTRVRFNLIDMAQVSTSGGNQLKLWTLSEYTLKSFATFKSGDETRVKNVPQYADHVWLPDDCLVALLGDGAAQLIVNGELVQTVQALATRGECLVALNNGEGVVIGGEGGTLALLRLVSKVMRDGEKEMHLQRQMRVSAANRILCLATDPTASTLVCCTEQMYGSYDLTNLCMLLGEDELLNLAPLASTPFSTGMDYLKIGTRRSCFVSVCHLPSGEHAIHVWNQNDGHECTISHVLDGMTPPQALDIHPSGWEVALALPTKLVIWFVLQDSLKPAFEVPLKHISEVLYSPSGAHLIAVQETTRTVFLYQVSNRRQREPELMGIYNGSDHDITSVAWSLSDRGFFISDSNREFRHLRLQISDVGEIDDFIAVTSTTTLMTPTNLSTKPQTIVVGVVCSPTQRDSHDYVTFAIEKDVTSRLRAWINGNLNRDSLWTAAPQVPQTPGLASSAITTQVPGMILPYDATALTCGPGRSLIIGTGKGAAIVLQWKISRLTPEGQRNIHVMPVVRQIDLHSDAVTGLQFSLSTQHLISSSYNGSVLITRFGHLEDPDTTRWTGSSHRNGSDDLLSFDTGHKFVSISGADEVGLYDRSNIELRKLKVMELEGDLQQVRMENELLNKQIHEQRLRVADQLQLEIRRHQSQAEQKEAELRSSFAAHLGSLEQSHGGRVDSLTMDAQRARDQYLASSERLQSECHVLRQQMRELRTELEDCKLSGEERLSELQQNHDAQIKELQRDWDQRRTELEADIGSVRRQLAEVLSQLDQDQLTQLAALSTTLENEKHQHTVQLGNMQGKMAARNQEVKMLLGALNQKDYELQQMRKQHDDDEKEFAHLREQLRKERVAIKEAAKEKSDLLVAAEEQRHVRENLERLNQVHRSQIELLQKNLLPKDRELEQMQQHLNQLHSTNQEIVIQANLSDRLRLESTAKARQYEHDVETAKRQLEVVRNSIVVLQDELGELVKQSAVQEKSAIVGEVMRIHKRLTRQLDVLQARDEHCEEISAELHRQNKFLMKNKQHLRRQMELAQQEKHKLVSALSYQNATLMHELNSLRKENKELERRASRRLMAEDTAPSSTTTRQQQSLSTEDLVDGRRLLGDTQKPDPCQQFTRAQARQRPKSAAQSLNASKRPPRPSSAQRRK